MSDDDPANGCTHHATARGPTSARAEARGSGERVADVWRVLERVTDPEIPVLNVVDMGIIADVRLEGRGVVVDVTPTFSGCPALDVIREDIASALKDMGEGDVTVNIVYEPQWTSERLTARGRQKLKEFGVAPPQKACCSSSMPKLEKIACPYCDSTNTDLESLFGPTLCRSIHYCRDCLQSFEHFKTV